MASKSNWAMDSIVLKFVTAPFKSAWILFLIVLIIFCSSLVLQTYFHRPSLLQQELANTRAIDTTPLIKQDSKGSSLNMSVSSGTYRVLSTLFFDLTGVNKALQAKPDDIGYEFKKIIKENYQVLTHLSDTLKVISLRIGNIALFIVLTVIVFMTAVIDGLVNRAVRQANSSRESAGIYHRAKYWRIGILWMSLMIYLCLPVSVSPYWSILPITLIGTLVFLQAKYLKKYL